jgi:hypothetical protein
MPRSALDPRSPAARRERRKTRRLDAVTFAAAARAGHRDTRQRADRPRRRAADRTKMACSSGGRVRARSTWRSSRASRADRAASAWSARAMGRDQRAQAWRGLGHLPHPRRSAACRRPACPMGWLVVPAFPFPGCGCGCGCGCQESCHGPDLVFRGDGFNVGCARISVLRGTRVLSSRRRAAVVDNAI